MAEGKDRPSASQEAPEEKGTSRYAREIQEFVRNRNSQQWVTVENKEVAADPEFLGEIVDAIRRHDRIPIVIESFDLPDKETLEFKDLWRTVVTQAVFSQPREKRAEFAEFLDETEGNDPRSNFWRLMKRLGEEGKEATIIWNRLEDILERIPDKEQRDLVAQSLFKALRDNARYLIIIADEKKWQGIDVNKMAFNEAASTRIR